MLSCARELFNMDDNVHYLNNAYMSPNLKSVEIAGIIGVQAKSKPYNIKAEDFFQPVDRLKASFSKLIHCPNPESIAIIPSASYGLANVAANLVVGNKKNIVIPAEQFPSNYYVWEKLAIDHNLEIRIIAAPSVNVSRAARWNEAILDAIDGDTLLLACGHVHWADGTLFDLEAFRIACSSVDAYLIVDGSQSVGALPFDVAKIKPDAMICVGYKWLFGPYGIGFAYYNDRFLEGRPIEENWTNRKGSDDFKNLVKYESSYQPGAARFTVGASSNFITVPMMQTALDQIHAWTIQGLQNYSESLISNYLDSFRSMGCVIEQDSGRCNHILGLRLPEGADVDLLSLKLQEKNIFVSVRGSCIRLATSIYNSRRDLDQFLSVLHRAEMV